MRLVYLLILLIAVAAVVLFAVQNNETAATWLTRITAIREGAPRLADPAGCLRFAAAAARAV
jgi:hypothetical protein